jgi:hypothetical protein
MPRRQIAAIFYRTSAVEYLLGKSLVLLTKGVTMTLDERIATLERSVAKQRMANIILAIVSGSALVAIVFLVVYPNPSRLVAQGGELSVTKLTVQDIQNRDRIILKEGAIVIKDENATDRIHIYARQKPVAQIRLFDQLGNARASLSADDDGNSLLAFYEPDGSNALISGVDAKIGPVTRILDSNGKRRFDLGMNESGEVLGAFYDEDNNVLINLGVHEHKGLFRIYDSKGKELASQP